VWTVAAISVSMSSVFLLCTDVAERLSGATASAQCYAKPLFATRDRLKYSVIRSSYFDPSIRAPPPPSASKLQCAFTCWIDIPLAVFVFTCSVILIYQLCVSRSCLLAPQNRAEKSFIIFSVVLSGLRQQEAQLSWRDRAMLRHWIHKSLKITQGHSK